MSSRLHARPKLRFLTFWKSCICSRMKKWKLLFRLHESLIFAMLRVCKKIQKKNTFFSKIAFYHVFGHILIARGSQNHENYQPVVTLPTPRLPRCCQDASKGDFHIQIDAKLLQNCCKLIPGTTRNDQERPGTTRNEEERPGTTRNDQEHPGTTRNTQERPGTTRNKQERPRTTRNDQEQPGTTRNNQERPGTTRNDQERPGTTRNNQ